MRRSLSLLLVVFLVTGCAARADGRKATARLNDEYALAVRRAAIAEQSQIVTDLQRLDRSNESLVWSVDGSRAWPSATEAATSSTARTSS